MTSSRARTVLMPRGGSKDSVAGIRSKHIGHLGSRTRSLQLIRYNCLTNALLACIHTCNQTIRHHGAHCIQTRLQESLSGLLAHGAPLAPFLVSGAGGSLIFTELASSLARFAKGSDCGDPPLMTSGAGTSGAPTLPNLPPWIQHPIFVHHSRH